MPEIFGTRWSRTELMRRLGRLEQAAGVRLVTLGDGIGRGVRVLEFRTGSGFAFDVLVDRCFDVGRCEFGGIVHFAQTAKCQQTRVVTHEGAPECAYDGRPL